MYLTMSYKIKLIFYVSCVLGCTDSENGMESDYNEENDEEIEHLLDSALPEELKNKKREYEERFKIVMEGMNVLK